MRSPAVSDTTDIREQVRERYAIAATSGSCCDRADRALDDTSLGVDIKRDRYSSADLGDLPAGAVEASLGCGNPTAVADLSEGETVLDLGSGGGIDVLLSAKRVGPTGF